MNLVELLLNSDNGNVVGEISRSLGLGADDTQKAIRQMAPALTQGIKRNTAKPGGLEALAGALQNGNHGRYLDRPDMLGQADTITDGNKILGHVFGSKDVSRNVAGHASQQTGIDAGLLKKMLPMLAAAAMGMMSKQTQKTQQPQQGGLLGQLVGAASGGGGNAGFLGNLLDSDQDGSAVDDMLSLAKKFF